MEESKGTAISFPLFGSVQAGSAAGSLPHGAVDGGVSALHLSHGIRARNDSTTAIPQPTLRWHPGQEHPATTTAGGNVGWYGVAEHQLSTGADRSTQYQLAAMRSVVTDQYFSSDTMKEILEDEARAVADGLDSAVLARRTRGLRGALATLPRLSPTGSQSAVYAAGHRSLSTLHIVGLPQTSMDPARAHPAVATSTALVTLGSPVEEIVAQGYGCITPGVSIEAAVAVRSSRQLCLLTVKASLEATRVPDPPDDDDSDAAAEPPTTAGTVHAEATEAAAAMAALAGCTASQGGGAQVGGAPSTSPPHPAPPPPRPQTESWQCSMRHVIDDLPTRSTGVALSPVIPHETLVTLDSGQLLHVSESAVLLPAPTAYIGLGGVGGVVTPPCGLQIGCEYGHHPRDLVVTGLTGMGARDLRSPPGSCWRLLWDIAASLPKRKHRVVSSATLRASPCLFAVATSGGVHLVDSRMPGHEVFRWQLGGGGGGGEPPAFLDVGAVGSAGTPGPGGLTQCLLTCSINTGTVVGYGLGAGFDLQCSPRATPTWARVVGTSKVGPCAVGLPSHLGTCWERRGAGGCPVLYYERWRSPTVGFATVPLPQANGTEGERAASVLALRATATGDLFARVCGVGGTAAAATAEASRGVTDAVVSTAWAEWSSCARKQEAKLGPERSSDDEHLQRTVAEGRKRAKHDGGVFAARLKRGPVPQPSVADPAAGPGLAGAAAVPYGPAQSAAVLTAIEACVASKGAQALHELVSMLEPEFSGVELSHISDLVQTSATIQLLGVATDAAVTEDTVCVKKREAPGTPNADGVAPVIGAAWDTAKWGVGAFGSAYRPAAGSHAPHMPRSATRSPGPTPKASRPRSVSRRGSGSASPRAVPGSRPRSMVTVTPKRTPGRVKRLSSAKAKRTPVSGF